MRKQQLCGRRGVVGERAREEERQSRVQLMRAAQAGHLQTAAHADRSISQERGDTSA